MTTEGGEEVEVEMEEEEEGGEGDQDTLCSTHHTDAFQLRQ